MLNGLFRRALNRADAVAAAIQPGLIPEGPCLITLLFHSLYLDRAEAWNGNQDPQQEITLDHFRRCLDAFHRAGYHFISPDDLASGTGADGRRVMITFDDGYYNNTRAVPILAEFGVPATFFISTGHVEQGKSFWWDAAYRGFAKQGLDHVRRVQRLGRWKHLRNEGIESEVKAAFGHDALRPVGDSDRPMTPAELADFARSPFVHLGNHTVDHAILPNYSAAEMASQIRGCQEALLRMTGKAPRIIAYPNGDCNAEAIAAARSEGLVDGIGLVPAKNPPGVPHGTLGMALRRFSLWGDRDIESQVKVFRSSLAPGSALRRLAKGGY